MAEQITIEEFRNNLKTAQSELLRRLEKVLKLSALRMEGRSKQPAFSRFNNNTGRLRQSIAGNFGVIEGRPVAILQAGGQFGGANVDYARYVEFGTKDPSSPRLVFFGKENGENKFRYVRRGIKPRLFLGRSVEAEKEQLTPDLKKLVTAVLLGRKNAGQ